MARLTVSRQELVEALRAQRRCASICTLVARTVPDKMVKRANPYWQRCLKIARVQGIINWRYENSVNRQRVREGKEPTFEELPRVWGERLEGEPFILYENRLYIELKVQHVLTYHYETPDGMRLDTPHVETFIPARRKQVRQGLDNDVILRDYAVDSLLELHGYGNEYVIGE